MRSDWSLRDRVVIVTGGASGMGLSTCQALAEMGAHAVAVDLPSEQLAAAPGYAQGPGSISAAEADVTDEARMSGVVAQVAAERGPITGLVACAGIRMRPTRVVDLGLDLWHQVIGTNLTGMMISCQAVAQHMVANGKSTTGEGRSIVTIGSLGGKAPRLGQAPYSVSKAGVRQLTKILALELAEFGIRANCICPGAANTPMMKLSEEQEGENFVDRKLWGDLAEFRGGIPLRQVAEPEDVAAAALYLLSPAAKHVTGQSLFVDGGESIL
jgi:2,3-dihydro-2,3-dihydroxybenzoate dehydrogenase